MSDKAFVIKWEDEEGDKVDISTQQELMLAMLEMKMIGSVYKLHIFLLENPWWRQVSVYFITWQGIKTNIMDQNMGSRQAKEAKSAPCVIIMYPERQMSQYQSQN